VNRFSRGYNLPIQTYHLSIDENLKDRDAGRFSFFMPGAIPVQKGYQSMEIIDTVDKTTHRYGTT
jgi:hypothetical protein